MTLGEKIYRLRAGEGLSQETFGERLGVSRQSVSKWETDQSVPELDKIVAISEIFGVSTDYLLKETEEAYREKEPYRTKTENPPREDAYFRVEYHGGRRRIHYEYKSKRMIGNLPLVHVNLGAGLYKAKGVIAVGAVAQGVLAIGLAAMGGLSIGIVSLGLLSIAAFAFGLIAFGSLAVGVISMGAISFGIFSLGAVAVGQFAFGASAHGAQGAVGDVASGNIALGYSRAVGAYTEVSNRNPFDYENACRLIDEHVSSNWLFFRTWAKWMVKIF